MPDARLRADCAACFGLCCVALAFSASADFAVDKAAGEPCTHLRPDFGCRIHSGLRTSGYSGCTSYDCFGAGQQVSQVTFAGQDWRTAPHTAAVMFKSLPVMQQLHELLWYLDQARSWCVGPLATEVEDLLRETDRLTRLAAAELIELDVARHRATIDPLLIRASLAARSSNGRPGPDHRRSDLMGAKLRGADLARADLRGAYLIGADLRRADLRLADLIGADLRGADLRGADLSTSLFLTQFQLATVRGDAATRCPPALSIPVHWSPSS